MLALPIDVCMAKICHELRNHRSLIVSAPPGSGKTTRVPWALLQAQLCPGKEVWVLEPRRVAAALAARRVAEEQGEELGEHVGFHVRFENIAGPNTRLRFLTEGILSRWMLEDPLLSRAGIVVLDEFHERHLQGDLALALLSHLQRTQRPDLKLVVMSATLDAQALSAYLQDATLVESDGSLYPVEVSYFPANPREELSSQLFRALKAEGPQSDSDILVFLPGYREIRKAQEVLLASSDFARFDIRVLHGEMPLSEQRAVLKSGSVRRIILATNVAESSLTIPGIHLVIDSGLARHSSVSPWSGITRLIVEKISQASAEQRAGRAGRLGPGRCIRLYSREDFAMRPRFTTAEIRRSDLSDLLLLLRGIGVGELPWYEAPPATSVQHAETLLSLLGAIDSESHITPLGREMLSIPLHPRLARMLLDARAQGLGEWGALAATILSEKDFVRDPDMLSGNYRCDVMQRAEVVRAWRRGDIPSSRGFDLNAVERLSQLSKRFESASGSSSKRESAAPSESSLLRIFLPAFLDRAAQRLGGQGDPTPESRSEYRVVSGENARLSPYSRVPASEFLILLEAEERARGKELRGTSSQTMIRLASFLDPEWLLEVPGLSLEERVEARWIAEAQRVELRRTTYFGSLALDSQIVSGPHEEAGTLLFEMASKLGTANFLAEDRETESLLQRISFVRSKDYLPHIPQDFADRHFRSLCLQLRGFTELRAAIRDKQLLGLILADLGPAAQQLERLAPQFLALPGRARVPVHYDGDSPWLASRLQDFFGLRSGPSVLDGKLPLVLHLLAPNQRAVQVTKDLPNFWRTHYPELRTALSRRYPRHRWPENPEALIPSAEESS